ncbi:Abi family protein [Enterococcus gilvus]|uniref:Abi family protein n=1 Tax=Enterococcus gilvus TaxID=160453 RepID=UPI00345EBB39
MKGDKMPFQLDKKFLTYNQQIELLKSRNLIIKDEAFAKWCLSHHGYYPLINGYSKPYLSNPDNCEDYSEGTQFERILYQYHIDRDLKSILFERIIDCENHLKTVLGYVVAESFGEYDKLPGDQGYIAGEDSYLYKNNFLKKPLLNSLIKSIRKTRNSFNSNPTKYYRDNKNHIPPWILFRNISLWEAKSLFQVLKVSEKIKAIPELFPYYSYFSPDITSKIMIDSYELMRIFRNNMAHGSRAYATRPKASLPLVAIETILGPQIVSKEEHKTGVGRNDLFGFLLVVSILSQDFDILQTTFEELQRMELKYRSLENQLDFSPFNDFLEFSNLPPNYIERLVSGMQYKYLNFHQ